MRRKTKSFFRSANAMAYICRRFQEEARGTRAAGRRGQRCPERSEAAAHLDANDGIEGVQHPPIGLVLGALA
ncbi:MAG: hypothetical protein R3B70_46380, partial [Polyangiaceae bacterium]